VLSVKKPTNQPTCESESPKSEVRNSQTPTGLTTTTA